jgi:hypothetical protein
VGAGGEMTQALYAHMNNKKIKIKKKIQKLIFWFQPTRSLTFRDVVLLKYLSDLILWLPKFFDVFTSKM